MRTKTKVEESSELEDVIKEIAALKVRVKEANGDEFLLKTRIVDLIKRQQEIMREEREAV